jgi:hypothetical protein
MGTPHFSTLHMCDLYGYTVEPVTIGCFTPIVRIHNFLRLLDFFVKGPKSIVFRGDCECAHQFRKSNRKAIGFSFMNSNLGNKQFSTPFPDG